MKQEIKIETEKDLCGDEYLENGELVLTKDDEYSSLVTMKTDDGFECVVSVSQLKTAINKLEAR